MTGVGAAVGLALKTASGVMDLGTSIYEKGREVGSFVYKSVRTLTGAEDNKNTVREDMAISLMERMEEVSDLRPSGQPITKDLQKIRICIRWESLIPDSCSARATTWSICIRSSEKDWIRTCRICWRARAVQI